MSKHDTKLMTRAEYARHRGCSPQAVTRAERERRITVTADGLIDPIAADAQWQARTRPRVRARDEATAEPAQESEHVSYQEARRRQAVADAIHAERELRRQAGELVYLKDVVGEYERFLIAVRESFLQLPPRLVPLLVADPTPAAMDRLLRDGIGDVLRALAVQPLPAAQSEGTPR